MKQIAFLDVEATGLNLSTDRIIEIHITKGHYFNRSFCDRLDLFTRINPGIPIPAEATEVHGITDEMVKDCNRFEVYADEIEAFIAGCDLGGFNILRFDIPILAEHLLRCGKKFSLADRKIVDVFACYKKLRPQSLEAAYAEFVSPDGFAQHCASDDVNATMEVLYSMIEKKKVPASLGISLAEEVEKFSFEEGIDIVDFAGKFKRKNGVIILNFGNHRGEPAIEHTDFLKWMLGKDFTQDTLDWAESIIEDSESTQRDLRMKNKPESEQQQSDDLPF